jgi:hypothetical protein
VVGDSPSPWWHEHTASDDLLAAAWARLDTFGVNAIVEDIEVRDASQPSFDIGLHVYDLEAPGSLSAALAPALVAVRQGSIPEDGPVRDDGSADRCLVCGSQPALHALHIRSERGAKIAVPSDSHLCAICLRFAQEHRIEDLVSRGGAGEYNADLAQIVVSAL